MTTSTLLRSEGPLPQSRWLTACEYVKMIRSIGSGIDAHGFESVGDILRRMRHEMEMQMTSEFSSFLSVEIDALLEEEQLRDEGREP